MAPAITVRLTTAFAALAVLAACGGSNPSPSPPTAGSATQTATAAVAPSSASSSPAASPDYANAKLQWQQGASASSATEGSYWSKAESDLEAGLASDGRAQGPSGASAYNQAIANLTQLISLPDSMQTAAQMREDVSDTTALNGFFDTPGLYS